jgi:methionyl-tRNA formyltransferase
MKKLKIIFIGGLSNGKIVLDYLQNQKNVEIPLIITHPKNHSGPRNVDLASIYKRENIKKELNANIFTKVISSYKPDFIFVSGWSGILSKELISLPKLGTIGFHPSKLPNDKGRSVLAWQIEEGYSETALTMFYYNEFPDCGDIIAQEKIIIEKEDYIKNILDKVDSASKKLMSEYFPLLIENKAPRLPQNINEGNVRKLRTDNNSAIDWNNEPQDIYNKVRAVSKPYPGAIGKINNNLYRIWKIVPWIIVDSLKNAPSGDHIIENGLPIIKCRNNCIKILEYDKL